MSTSQHRHYDNRELDEAFGFAATAWASQEFGRTQTTGGSDGAECATAVHRQQAWVHAMEESDPDRGKIQSTLLVLYDTFGQALPSSPLHERLC